MILYLIPLGFITATIAFWLIAPVGRKQGASVTALLLSLYLVSQLFLAEIDFGPYSLRVYFAIALAVVAAARLEYIIRELCSTQSGTLIHATIVLCLLFTGLAAVDASLRNDEFSNFASKFLLSVVVCLGAIAALKSRADCRFVLVAYAFFALLTSVTAYLQYWDFQFGQFLREALRPISIQGLREEVGGDISLGGMELYHGLNVSSFDMGRLVSVGASLVVAFVYFSKGSGKFRYLCALVWVLYSMACVVAQSRSAVLWCASLPLIGAALLARKKQGQAVLFLATSILVISTVAFYYYQSVLNTQSAEAKMLNYYDSARLTLAGEALSTILSNPEFGVGLESFRTSTGVTPHNTFLNAGVAFGLPGFLLSVLFVGWTVMNPLLVLLRADGAYDWIYVGAYLALLSYIWDGMTHNDSFVVGSPNHFVLAALMVAAARFRITPGSVLPHRGALVPAQRSKFPA